jgi:thymidylate kinase
MKITILEGGRGTGKSTVAFKLRQRVSETTLINFTGFHDDGERGLKKVTSYYHSWMDMLSRMSVYNYNFVFDRFYFSESIFSELYKNYDFTDTYRGLNNSLEKLSTDEDVKVNIFFLTINDEEELAQRLIRDKVPFGKAEESVAQTLKQQEMYSELFKTLNVINGNKNLKIFTIDTSGKTNDEVYDEIMKLETTN